MTESSKPSQQRAAGVAWNLGDLYGSIDDPAIDKDLATALKRAEAFAAAHRGKIAALKPTMPTSSLVRCANSRACRADGQACPSTPCSCTPPRPTTRGTALLLARTREQRTAINKHLIFFDLEWIQLADDAAGETRRPTRA